MDSVRLLLHKACSTKEQYSLRGRIAVNITKLDLAVRVAKRLNKPVTESKLVIETFLDEVMNVLTDDHRIEIRGFGVFKTKTRKSRRGRNPRTGESVQVPS